MDNQQELLLAPTHSDLVNSLADHLRGPRRMVWTEKVVYNNLAFNAGTTIPDVFTIQTDYGKPLPSVYEVKASRSDFRQDVRSEKWRKYLPYTARFYFVTGPDVVTETAEIPDDAGWMRFDPDRGWIVARGAPNRRYEFNQYVLLSLLFAGDCKSWSALKFDNESLRLRVKSLEGRLKAKGQPT